MRRCLKAIEVRVPSDAAEVFSVKFGVNSKLARIERIDGYRAQGAEVDAIVWVTDAPIDDIEEQKRIAGSLEQKLLCVRWPHAGEGSVPLPDDAGAMVGRFTDRDGNSWLCWRAVVQAVADEMKPASPRVAAVTPRAQPSAEAAPRELQTRGSSQSAPRPGSAGETSSREAPARAPEASRASSGGGTSGPRPNPGRGQAPQSPRPRVQSQERTHAPRPNTSDAQLPD